jgi:sugar transferase (PEP-CTERM/EpsH1 system associated)
MPRVNVLFLTHRLPYAPNRGDRVRAYFMLRELRRHADVTLVSLVHDDEEASHASSSSLRDLASTTYVVRVPAWRNRIRSLAALPTRRPTTHTMLDAPELRSTIAAAVAASPPDVVFAYCSGIAPCALEPPLAERPLVIDLVDVDSAKWSALAAVTRWPLSSIYRREARTLRAFEAIVSARAIATLITTTREAETLRSIAPDARVHVIENGVDVASLQPRTPPVPSSDVVFCGVMNYAPNEQAVLWLARSIWPRVRARRSDATLTIVGSHPTRAIASLASDAQGIRITGGVPDVRPYLWRAAVAVAPILTARGIQNKVLEAVAAGLPTVVTPNIMSSLPATIADACVAGDTADALADAIVGRLEQSPEQRRALAARARVDALTWERQLAPVAAILAEAAGRR